MPFAYLHNLGIFTVMHNDISELQHRIHTGDTQAFKKLYDCFGPQLLQLAIAMVHTKEMAEEIVEDVFIQVWTKKGHLNQVSNLKGYLYTTTRNIALNYLRKYAGKKTFRLEDLYVPEYQVSHTPEDQLISNDMIRRINIAISQLPPQCRLIFKLVKEDSLKYREVAALLNVSVKTVENQVGIALKKLHHLLSYLPSSH